ncbi:cupin domain-containing protein [Halovenus salina]|uniref:Cupin domain-containing protein n=1 Tax=Halovenus salina TaxID=1510225 RepID=A0ABD5W3C1_9EURY|nr:cupin domain-containing protein [Halovenus salina]
MFESTLKAPRTELTARPAMTDITSLDDLDGQPHANVFPDAEPKTVRLALDEGQTVPEHTHPGRDIVLTVLDGEIDLQLGDDTHELTAGDIARFTGDQQISPTATRESTALIVLAPADE